jgi:hypothetical protein
MHELWTHQLESWHEFYVLVGTAGLTLTGLLFVVVSLRPRFVASRQATGVRAFVSPNAVYFTTTLVVSAFFLVPDLPATVAGTTLCFGAAASLFYLVYTRAHYEWRRGKLPPLDWVWFVGLPLLSYLLLLVSGAGILVQSAYSMHGVGAGLVLLIIIGIRNAWDLVLWISQQEHKE